MTPYPGIDTFRIHRPAGLGEHDGDLPQGAITSPGAGVQRSGHRGRLLRPPVASTMEGSRLINSRNGLGVLPALQRGEWIGRCESRLRTACPLLSSAAAVSYAIAAVRGLGHESPEETADHLAVYLPKGSALARSGDC